MIYLKENGEKKNRTISILSNFLSMFPFHFFPTLYIYTEPKNLPVVEIHSRVYIYKLTLLKVRRIQLDTKYIYLDLFRKQFILHHYMIARITKGRGGGIIHRSKWSLIYTI